jgi:hypothetical protein
MKLLIYLLTMALYGSQAAAQESNILGLPAVPQTAASGAKAGAAPAGPLIRDVEGKAILSGGMQMASSYAGKITTVRVTTIAAFNDPDSKTKALAAARLMQRDLPLSCGAQCKSAAMPEPKILPDGKVQFDLNIEGFPRIVDRDDMVNMIKGVPLIKRAGTPVKTASNAKPVPAAKSPTSNALTATSATAVSQ